MGGVVTQNSFLTKEKVMKKRQNIDVNIIIVIYVGRVFAKVGRMTALSSPTLPNTSPSSHPFRTASLPSHCHTTSLLSSSPSLAQSHAPHFPREPDQSLLRSTIPHRHLHPSPQQTLTARRHEGHLVSCLSPPLSRLVCNSYVACRV